MAAAVMVLVLVGTLIAIRPWAQGREPAAERDPLIDPTYYASPSAVCNLLTPEDLALVLGYTYSDGFEPDITYPGLRGLPGVTRCAYVHEELAEPAVNLGVVYAYARDIFAERRGDMDDAREVDVHGATRAVWAAEQNELMVLADDMIVSVSGLARDEAVELRLERTRRLAETAIGRLR